MRGNFEGVLHGDLWGWNGGGQLPTSHMGTGNLCGDMGGIAQGGRDKGAVAGVAGGRRAGMPIPRTQCRLWGVLGGGAGYQSGMGVELIVGRFRRVGGGAHGGGREGGH